ncbi:hypothetical protein PITC_090960 [Penicillium italicum]|uniref:Uncharacterized protein n=1 Tax=Penicillium italicum TaxID=40296 RepID=A0A0A2L9H6_PENIT|nr:hypothetical protein PITC_090960 [Penicillium italicum]
MKGDPLTLTFFTVLSQPLMMQEGHTWKNCSHIEGLSCHEHGHMSCDCPNTECSYCHTMGHCKSS